MGQQPSVFIDDPNQDATVAAAGQPSWTGTSFPTSTQATPIPIMWGTRRLSPNIIWQSTLVLNYNTNTHVFDAWLVGGLTDPWPTHHWETAFTDPIIGGVDANGFYSPAGGSKVGNPITAPMCARMFGSVTTHVDTSHFGDPQVGSEDSGSTDSRWWVPVIMALCEGPINATNPITRIWFAQGQPPAVGWAGGSWQVNGSQRPWGVLWHIGYGTSTQTPWGLFAAAPSGGLWSSYTAQNLAYNSTAYVASAWCDYGHDNKPPRLDFEVIRTPNSAYQLLDSYGLGYDYSLADIIPDILTSPQYGMGLLSTDIDAASLLQFFKYQAAQGLYFSPLLNGQTTCVDVINRWAAISNTWIFWDGVVIRFVPLGDEALTANGQTYTPDLSPAYTLGLGDFLEPDGVIVERADPTDCDNRLRLEYYDRSNDYSKNPIEWKDTTLVNLYGIRDASSISGEDICDVVVAAKCVELIGKRGAYIRNTYNFKLSYRYIRVLPGTILALNDPNIGLVNKLVRVRSIEEDEQGVLSVIAEEYPGTLGLSRPQALYQVWGPTNGQTGGGSGSSGGGGGTMVPTSTSGGVLVQDPTMTLVLYVAGDVITLPALPAVGVPYTYKHDQKRSPQPTPAILEANPVTFQRPSGATYTIEDPQDWTLAYAASVTLITSGKCESLVNMGDGTVRWVP